MIEKNELSLDHFIKVGFDWKKKKRILSNYKSSWVQEALAMAIFLSSSVKLSKYALSFSGLLEIQLINTCLLY